MPKKITQQEFISRARSVHGEKYDYAKVSLINTATPVVIICPEHGEFCIRPQKHLAGQGCKKCGYNRNRQTLRKTTTWFVEKATQVHNGKYDYSQAVYVGAEDDIDIICPNHGIFLQRPNDHLQDKGCPKCKAEKAKSPICGVGINDVIGG